MRTQNVTLHSVTPNTYDTWTIGREIRLLGVEMAGVMTAAQAGSVRMSLRPGALDDGGVGTVTDRILATLWIAASGSANIYVPLYALRLPDLAIVYLEIETGGSGEAEANIVFTEGK